MYVIVICASSEILSPSLSDFFSIPIQFGNTWCVRHSARSAPHVCPAYGFNCHLSHTVTPIPYSKHSTSVPPSATLSFSPRTSPHHPYPPRHVDRHSRHSQQSRLPSRAASPSEESPHPTSPIPPQPQPSSSPQRPQHSSPLCAPSLCIFPGIQPIKAPLHHVLSSTSFAMGMSTSVASCTKTRTSFSSTYSTRSSRRYSTTSTISTRTRRRMPLLPTPPARTVSTVLLCVRHNWT